MEVDYPVDDAPATPEYVLDVLRESVRLQVGPYDLNDDSSLTDLLAAYDDLTWPSTRLLADCVNQTFDVEISVIEWHRGFPRVWGRTVRELCEFLAPRVTRPVVRPWLPVPAGGLPAGAFLSIRSILAGRGIDPDRITPSDPPDAVPFADLNALFWRLNLIAPGRVPPPRERGFLFHYVLGGLAAGWLLLGTILGVILTVLGVSTGTVVTAAVGIGMTASGVAAGWLLCRVHRPPFVGSVWAPFPTFRDLAYCLAGEQPRRRIQPSP